MISIKRYLNASREEAPLRKVISLLISKIGSTAVRCDLAEFEAFTTDIEGVRNRLSPDLTPDSLMGLAEASVQALTTYNKRIRILLDTQRNEVQNILSMLQNTVVNIAGENTRSGKRLQEITLELEESGRITDLRVLKGRLTECLTGLREEMLQQKTDAAVTLENLRVTIERGRDSVALGAEHRPDPVTGLPGHDEAVAAMETAVGRGTRQYAIVMIVNRVQMINRRFGQKLGDHMLVGFKEHVAKQLSGSDQLFRWTGPTFVAILERPKPIGIVRLEVKRLLDAKIEVNYSAEGKSVLIPVSAIWSALPLTCMPDADKQIQEFVTAQSNREDA
jgi:GGDEF domain-containing protein